MRKRYLSLSITIFVAIFVSSCGKNNEITYANLQGEWYSETCGTTILFTTDSTLTMLSDGLDEVHECIYSLDLNGKIYITYNEYSSEHNIEFINNRRIMIDGMGVMSGFEKGEHIFKKVNS